MAPKRGPPRSAYSPNSPLSPPLSPPKGEPRSVAPDAPLPRRVLITTGTPTARYSDRTRLAYQYRRGNQDMDNDTDLEQSFNVHHFALGSTRTESRALKFMSGYESQADFDHSRLSFNYDRRWIYLYIIPSSFHTTPPAFVPLEAEIPFEDIVTGGVRAISMDKRDDDKALVTLTITTRRPARFYSKLRSKPMMRRCTERDFVFSLGPKESTPGRSVEEMKMNHYIIHEGHAGPLTIVSNELTVKVNSWLTWQFQFLLDKQDRARFRQKIIDLGLAGKEDGLDLLAHKGEKKIRTVKPENMLPLDPAASLKSLEFRLRYLVEGLVSHGICVPSEIPELVSALAKTCSSDDLKERVLTSLFNEERIRHILSVVRVRARQLRKRRLNSDPFLVWVYRCLVTPTRVCLFPAEQETSNDALRRHARHLDRFLRVQFADEEDRLRVNPTVIEADAERPAEGTIARVRRALDSGLDVAGRHYVFLAYGSSSAREHTCWFVAEDAVQEFTADSVRRSLGFDFITEKIVAKHAARMGIPFSATRAVNLHANIRKDIPDVYTKDKICFTDGVGRCGWKIARAAARAFGFTEGVDALPSAIQIRCRGIKGVLAVWPDLCRATDVAFRPSQIKFQTDRNGLGFSLNAVRISQYHRSFLNRQFIMLMSHLGVADVVFEELFHEAIVQTRGLPERFESGRPSGKDLAAASGLASPFKLKELTMAGFNRNPMFNDVCKVLETQLLTNYKWKARLEIKKSVYLIGIADEANVLREGEVFCQYENPAEPDQGPVVVKGLCAVMRAPALHPGDIRMVKAVDRPELHHLKNVIVFSVRGRPLPNMLSGGDLDGDDYTLIWDERLLPKLQQDPADYTPPTPVRVPVVKLQDVKEFFISYILNDILGQVSNAHLAHADRIGPDSRMCRDLAHLASIAVDFPKTGIPARMKPEMRARRWPTYMGKDIAGTSKDNYESRKILGKLFRMISPEPIYRPVDIRTLPAAQVIDPRMMRFVVPPSVLDDAYRLKQDYDQNVLGLMRRYKITEAEVISGIILRNPTRRKGRDADLKDPVDQNYKALKENVMELADRFLRKRTFTNSPITPQQIYATAAYQVTYVETVRKQVEERLGIKDELAELLDAVSLGRPLKEIDDNASVAPTEQGSVMDYEVNGPPPMISFPFVWWEELTTLPNMGVRPNGVPAANGQAGVKGQAPNGYANDKANGYANGHAKRPSNGVNGEAKGNIKAQSDGSNGDGNDEVVDGKADGGADGHPNGHDYSRQNGRTPNGRAHNGRTPNGRTPDGRTPNGRASNGRTLNGRTPNGSTPNIGGKDHPDEAAHEESNNVTKELPHRHAKGLVNGHTDRAMNGHAGHANGTRDLGSDY